MPRPRAPRDRIRSVTRHATQRRGRRFDRLRRVAQLLFPKQPPAPLKEKWAGALGSLVATLGLGWISLHTVGPTGTVFLIASMGSSAVLLFAAAHSPLAQPWPFVGGHLVSAFIGVTMHQWVPDPVLAAALAVSLSIFVMHVSNCLHPPGGATALTAVFGGPEIDRLGYEFLLAPLGLNIVVYLALAVVVNNVLPGRRYPFKAPEQRPDRYEDPLNWVLNRAGLKTQDLEYALRQIGGYIDVSPDDLQQIHARASLHAFERRMGKITCGDIMARDVTTVEYGTHLEEVWQLMRTRRVKGLPVLDRARRVIGIVTIVDFIKRADARPEHVFDRLVRFIRQTPGLRTEKPEVAGEIMTPSPITAREDEHILTLVPLFSEHDIHHIPIVGHDGKLTGMVTQSDLMAALYNYRAGDLRRPIRLPQPKGSGESRRHAG